MKTFSKSPADSESLETVLCPVCGGSNFSRRWCIEGVPYVTCRRCTLVLQNPRPVSEALAARYDEEYFRYEIDNEENFFRLMMQGLRDICFFENVANTLPMPKRILDVGCATGRLLHHFKQLGWHTSGVELCIPSAEYGNGKYEVGIHIGDLESAVFPDDHFSLVHASHIIEHVDDPAAFAEELHRILIPGGVFVCVTPSVDGFQARLFREKWRSAIPDHVTLFNKNTLRRLLKNQGFFVEAVRTWGGLGAGTAPGWIKNIADRMAKKTGFGDVVLMMGRKDAYS